MKIIQFDNYNILIGKNKDENWKLIDEANENDYWFHLNNYPSCHVILKINNEKIDKKVDKKVLKFCALECKKNSKYNNQKITICYTKIKNIKKGNNIGSVIYDISNIKLIDI